MLFTKQVLHISFDLLYQMLDDAQARLPLESGGILMGYRNKHGYWLSDIIGPGSNAKHERFSFTPDYDFHQEQVAKIYLESGRIHTYLGDWHTHPESKAYLSDRDKRTIRNISSDPESYLPEPIMLIIGTHPLEMKAWIYMQRSMKKYWLMEIRLF